MEGFYWVATKRYPDEFEPARVDYRDGKPDEVWFIGCDMHFEVENCIIAEKIERGEMK